MGIGNLIENAANEALIDINRITNGRQDEQIQHLTKVVRILWRKIEHLERMVDVDRHQLTLKSGSASITLKQNGSIAIKGRDIAIEGSGDVRLKGSKMAEN